MQEHDFYSEGFVDSLPDDTLLALNSICTHFSDMDKALLGNPKTLQQYLQALAVFRAYANLKAYGHTPVQPGSNPAENINQIRQFFAQQHQAIIRLLNTEYLEKQTSKYADRIASESAYVFNEDDYARIQVLVNEIRELIQTSAVISERHKRRLLERLERLQQELHKTTSDLDRFWGFVGEAGIVLGKFGKDMQPLVQRVRELAEIVWKTIGVTEKLLADQNPITLPDSPDSE